MVYFITNANSIQMVISVYEVLHVFVYNMDMNNIAPWAEILIVMNTLLVVFNSSINFAFYCGDVVFRECLKTLKIAECLTGRKRDSNGGGGDAAISRAENGTVRNNNGGGRSCVKDGVSIVQNKQEV